MRFLILISLALAALAASAAEPAQPYPFWDGHETIAEYAKKTGLEPTKTLELGDGVKLELVLIPAGKFVMGTPEPEPVDEESFRSKMLMGALAVGGGVLWFMIASVQLRTTRKRQRVQFSLAWLLGITVAAGMGLLGGMHWYYTARALADAQSKYEAAMASFENSIIDLNPAHDVTISMPYYMGKFEVTQEQYQEVMGTNPSLFNGRDLPAEHVSWLDSQEFCKKASEKTGSSVRLPTDAEWEHACRAGTKTTYHAGDTETDLDRAGWYDKNSGGKTHPVGEKAPNEWGAHDMHGNVWEWCADWFETYKAEPVVDPQGPTKGQYRVLRGGSWLVDPGNCRSTFRITGNPDYRLGGIGFRVVWLVPRTP